MRSTSSGALSPSRPALQGTVVRPGAQVAEGGKPPLFRRTGGVAFQRCSAEHEHACTTLC